jgi:hypothetical protein
MSMALLPVTEADAGSHARRITVPDRLWMVLRPHRSAIIAGLAVVAATVIALTVAWAMVSGHPQCSSAPHSRCGLDLYNTVHWHNWVAVLLRWTAILPGLGALTWGVPVAREFEQRTTLLAWGQDVTARQWLAAKIAAMLSLSAITAVALGLPAEALSHAMQQHQLTESLLQSYYFETGIPNLVGYALLATAVGLLAGLAIRRTLPALAVAAVGCVGIRLGLRAVRPHLLPVSTVLGPSGHVPASPADGWYISDGFVTSSGHRISRDSVTCFSQTCLREAHIVGRYTDYQPAGHLLGLRLVEGGICVALAAVAILISFETLRRLSH